MSRPAIDQLPLELSAEPTQAPRSLRPMLPRPGGRPPTDGKHLFDVSWGGLRVLAHLGAGRPRLIVHGRDLAARFPELAGALEGVAAPGTILDGEIVVPDATGGPDRAALRDRLRARAGIATPGAAFVISDLPWFDGRSLLAEPLRVRRARLDALHLERSHLVVLAPVAEHGGRLLEAVRERGLAAVIAKRLDSPYLPGVRSRLWRFLRIGPTGGAEADGAELEPAEPVAETLLALLRTLPLGMDG
jgi:bifunctional non-homologous end joining protein LigD